MRTRPYDDGLAAPFGVVPLLYRREKCVHIDVQNGHAAYYTNFSGTTKEIRLSFFLLRCRAVFDKLTTTHEEKR